MILYGGGTELNPVADWAITLFGHHFIVWNLPSSALPCSCYVFTVNFASPGPRLPCGGPVQRGLLYQVVLISCFM